MDSVSYACPTVTYEPLHHKYRPQTFAQLVGQNAIACTLTNALQTNRIAPAYLFAGPRGTGKTSSARIMAKSLNCLRSEQPTPSPCGECEVCRGIANGSLLDVIEIDAASNTGVDNIRELIERAQFAPVQCRYKVYVIDECHMLSVAAFNALLKTLEEPPERVVFILATTDPQRVLSTITSRCQQFDFRRIPLDAMVTHLQAIATAEKISITPEALKMVAQIAQGGLRDAESLLDQLSLLGQQIAVEDVRELVGAVPERDLMALLQAILTGNPTAVLDGTRELLDRGREPMMVLQSLAEFYRDLLIAKTSPVRSDLVKLTPGTWQELCQVAQRWDVSAILSGQQHLRSSEAQIRHTTQPRLWLEVIFMGLLSAEVHPVEVASVVPKAAAAAQPVPAKPLPQKPPAKSIAKELPARKLTRSEPTSTTPITSSPISANAEVSYQVSDTSPDHSLKINPETQELPAESDNNYTPAELEHLWQQVLEMSSNSIQAILKPHGQLTSFDGQAALIEIDDLQKIRLIRAPRVAEVFQRIMNRPIKVILDVAPPKLESPRELESPRVRERTSGEFTTSPNSQHNQASPNSARPNSVLNSAQPNSENSTRAQISTVAGHLPTQPMPVQMPVQTVTPVQTAVSMNTPQALDRPQQPSSQQSLSKINSKPADAEAVVAASQRLVNWFEGEVIDTDTGTNLGMTSLEPVPADLNSDLKSGFNSVANASDANFRESETSTNDDVPF
ncbi:MAG: DNA polymerase III subunit gamma/tau [Microcoleaceae cyanobacterium]